MISTPFKLTNTGCNDASKINSALNQLGDEINTIESVDANYIPKSNGNGYNDSVFYEYNRKIVINTKYTPSSSISSNPSADFTINQNDSLVIPASLAGTGISIIGADGAPARYGLSSFGTAGTGAFAVRHARGTAATPTAVQSGDQICSFEGWGYGATAYTASPKVMFRGYAAQNWTDTKQGSKAAIWTTTKDTVVPVKRVEIDEFGSVFINSPNVLSILSIKAPSGDIYGGFTLEAQRVAAPACFLYDANTGGSTYNGLFQLYSNDVAKKVQFQANGASYLTGGNFSVGSTSTTYKTEIYSDSGSVFKASYLGDISLLELTNTSSTLCGGSSGNNSSIVVGTYGIAATSNSNITLNANNNSTSYTSISCGTSDRADLTLTGGSESSTILMTVNAAGTAYYSKFDLQQKYARWYLQNDTTYSTQLILTPSTLTLNGGSTDSVAYFGINKLYPTYNLQIVGTSYFGEASTNYADFESTGFLHLAGSAKGYKDIFFPMAPPKSTGVGNPTLITWNSIFRNYAFAVNDVHDFDPQEYNHDGIVNDASGQWHIHIVSMTNTGATRGIKFQVDFSQANPLGGNSPTAFPAATTISAEYTVPANTPVGTHILFDIGNAFTTLYPTSMMCARLTRITASGTAPANDPIVLGLHYHYKVDTPAGSRSITAK